MEVEVPRNFRQNSCELKVKNMKFKAKAKNNNLVLKVSATGGEAFNENAVSQFTALGLNAFLPATKVSKKAVQFEGPVAITLAKRLATPVGGYDFLSILEQIVLANRTLTANNFPIFHMAMTAEKVFFVEETGELKFVYAPLEAGFTGENMIDFINSLITMAKPADSVANDVILRFGDYFKGLMPFHIDAVESFVEAENPHVVEALRHLGPATQAIDTDSDDTVILGANAGFVPDSDDTVVLDSGANYGSKIEEIAEREGVIFADENSAEAFDAMDLDGDPSVEAFVVGETYEPIDLGGAVPVQPAETYEPVDLGGAIPLETAPPIDLNNGVGAQTEQGFTGAIDLDFNSPLMTVTEPLDDASAESAEPITEKTAEPEQASITVETEPISEPEPIIKAETEPEQINEPVSFTAEPEPVVNITAEPDAITEKTAEPEQASVTVEPEPISEPEPIVKEETEPEQINEPVANITAESAPEPVVTVQPTVEPELEPVVNITVEPEITPEPVANITAKPEPVVSVEEDLNGGAKTEDDFYDAVTEVLYTPPTTPPEGKGRLVQAVLVVQSTGQKAVINSNKFTIGKSLGCDLTIKNSNVSREHATIFFDGMDFYVADNASTNGTHLNGVLLSPNEWHKMAVDDRLSLANEIVDFLIEEREQ